MHNVQGLTSRKFFYAGMLAAVSFANGGPGLNCLSKTVYTYLRHGLQCKFTPDLSLIPDLDIKESLEEQVSLYEGNINSAYGNIHNVLWMCISNSLAPTHYMTIALLYIHIYIGISVNSFYI